MHMPYSSVKRTCTSPSDKSWAIAKRSWPGSVGTSQTPDLEVRDGQCTNPERPKLWQRSHKRSTQLLIIWLGLTDNPLSPTQGKR